MTVPAAPDPEEVAAELCRWLASRFGGPVTEKQPPARVTGGLDFWIYAIHLAGPELPESWGKPLIARIPPTSARHMMLERETRLQSWVAEHGFPAPAVVELLPPGELFESSVQVVARAPGITMGDAMSRAPWRVPDLIGQLGVWQARLHAIPVPEWAAEAEWSLLERRLGLVRHLVASGDQRALEEGLIAIERLRPRLEGEKRALCHGDFHPLNVLVDRNRLAIIDWTDAGVGDRHGDAARTAWLFTMAGAAAPKRGERAVLRAIAPALRRRFSAAYKRQLPLDPDRLRLWLPVHLLHLWAMTVADEHELAGPSRAGQQYHPALGEWARNQFQLSLRNVE